MVSETYHITGTPGRGRSRFASTCTQKMYHHEGPICSYTRQLRGALAFEHETPRGVLLVTKRGRAPPLLRGKDQAQHVEGEYRTDSAGHMLLAYSQNARLKSAIGTVECGGRRTLLFFAATRPSSMPSCPRMSKATQTDTIYRKNEATDTDVEHQAYDGTSGEREAELCCKAQTIGEAMYRSQGPRRAWIQVSGTEYSSLLRARAPAPQQD